MGLARKIDDFIIPLNLDGSRVEDLDLLRTAVTYIPFDKGRAGGFAQLLAKLAKVDAPRTLPEGKHAVVSWLYTQQKFVEAKQERLWSNILPIVKFPKELRRYYLTNIPDAVKDNWPTYTKSRNVVWAFGPPGKDASLNARLTRSANWTTELEADDLDMFSIVSGILREAIQNVHFALTPSTLYLGIEITIASGLIGAFLLATNALLLRPAEALRHE